MFKTALEEAGEDARHYYLMWKAAERREAKVRAIVREEIEWNRLQADLYGCDAGNWDGGDPRECLHCLHLQKASDLEARLQ